MPHSLKCCVFLMFFISNISLSAQDQLGVYGSLSYGNLVNHSDVGFFKSNWSPSFGLLFSRKLGKRVNLVCQVGHEKLGWIAPNFDGFNARSDLYLRGNSINLFLGGKYEFIANSKFKLGIIILPKIGYVYKQEYLEVENGKVGISLFHIDRTLLLGLDSKLNLQVSLSDLIDIGVRPGFSLFSHFDDNEYIDRKWSIDFFISKRISTNSVEGL